MGHTKRLPAILFAASLAAALASPALAEAPPVEPVSVEISVAGLDLDNPEGAQTAASRIDRAARTACGGEPVPSPAFPRSRSHFETCVAEAVAGAAGRIDGTLTADLLRDGFRPVTEMAAR